LNATQKEGKAMNDPAIKETDKQNNETLYPLSADEIHAVQEMRKLKAETSPETLALVERFCQILEERLQENNRLPVRNTTNRK
jgi:hypothetical protein